MRYRLDDLPDDVIDFLTVRHLATLSVAVSGTELHSSPVGFMWDHATGRALVITYAAAKKVRLIDAAQSLSSTLTQVDGGRWLTLHGQATVTADTDVCADAVERYVQRYGPARDLGDERRTIIVEVTKILGRT